MFRAVAITACELPSRWRLSAQRRAAPEAHLALPSQIVCGADLTVTVTVDGVAMCEKIERNRRGRSLPVLRGCRNVPATEVLLMNRQSEDSLEGRFFGLLPAAGIADGNLVLLPSHGLHRGDDVELVAALGAAALITAVVISSMLVIDRATSAELARLDTPVKRLATPRNDICLCNQGGACEFLVSRHCKEVQDVLRFRSL
jgi:hypothetical protein